ncbi:MAG: DUF1624 domain-containing protein [Clostridia bacterium]|nr:DUF1624 domain-containing protein [Clostridia bacterium]
MQHKESVKTAQTGEQKRERLHMLDTLRGLMIVGVVLFHFVFDMYRMDSEWAETFINAPIFELIANVGRILFLLLAGICTRFSRNNLKRGLFVAAAAVIISVATAALDFISVGSLGNLFIYFGILHLMAVCMLLYALSDIILSHVKLNPNVNAVLRPCIIALFALAFVITFRLYDGSLGIGGFSKTVNCGLNGTLLGVLLGFHGFLPLSADYFPLMPWAFAFFAGSFLGAYFQEGHVPKFLYKNICPPLTFAGRHTLIIYLAHQPLIYGIAVLVSYIHV